MHRTDQWVAREQRVLSSSFCSLHGPIEVRQFRSSSAGVFDRFARPPQPQREHALPIEPRALIRCEAA
jgi:hypothetical protein